MLEVEPMEKPDMNQPNPEYVTPPDGTVVGIQVNFLTGERFKYVMRNGQVVPEGDSPGGDPEEEKDN